MYYSIKIAAIFVFLLLYCWVVLRYQYRERTEVVNERWMIEEICERNIDRREEYERDEEENAQSIVLLLPTEQQYYGAV